MESSTDMRTTDITDNPDPTPSPIIYKMPDSYATVIFLMIAFVMFFSLIGNILALTSLCRNRKSVYPWFFNLAMSDLLKTLLCMPYSMYLTQSQYFSDKENFVSDTKCVVIGYIFNLTLLMGLISNMCVALDRVHATYFPFHYSNNMKRCPPLYYILLTWILVPIIAGLPFYLQSRENVPKAPFAVSDPYMPMCIFDIWDAPIFREDISKEMLDAYVVLYYVLLYLLPILVIITCTILVMKKLLPRILAERKLYDCTKSSVVIANSTALGEDPGLTTVGEENQLNNLSPNGGATPSKSGKKGMFSVLDNMLKLHTGSKPVTRKHAKRNQEDRNKSDSPTILYWRAVQTMMIVSVAFVFCHVVHLMYWVLYKKVVWQLHVEVVTKTLPYVEFVVLSCINTGQIVIVYLDAAVNVIVYYSRCTLIRESMCDTARTFITFLISPVLMLLRRSRD